MRKNEVKFVMLVGLPGSGKSSLADEYSKLGYNVHASDAIREEITGDINRQDINQTVFNILHKRVKEDLINGKDCVYDATNINYKKRKAFISELSNIKCYKVAVVIATPYEVCLRQNEHRDRKVPEEVIERMYKSFDIPYFYEGWDEIEIHYNDCTYKNLYGDIDHFLADTIDFDQDSKYHSETLGEHCRLCGNYIVENYTNNTDKEVVKVISDAAFLHDCGKPFVKTFKDSKGNDSDTAHYYNHEHVGSYNSLFYDTHEKDKLYIATLIRWHMQMHFVKKEGQQKSLEKYKNIFGKVLWDDLCKLNVADKEAH